MSTTEFDIAAIAKRIATQDNHGVADPIFIVQRRTQICGVDTFDFVTCFFTKEAAVTYIEQHKNELGTSLSFVGCLQGNPEMIAVRKLVSAIGLAICADQPTGSTQSVNEQEAKP